MSPKALFFCLRTVDRIRVRVKNSPHYCCYLLFSIHAKRCRRILWNWLYDRDLDSELLTALHAKTQP